MAQPVGFGAADGQRNAKGGQDRDLLVEAAWPMNLLLIILSGQTQRKGPAQGLCSRERLSEGFF